MAVKKSQEEILVQSNDFQGFLEEFQNESDRSAAIIGAAFLDEHLKQLLTNFFVDDPKEVAHLLSSESPLGSFGARIRAAYCLGLVSREYFQSLKLIKDVRNAFAHQLHGLTFDDKEIAAACRKLQALQPIKSRFTQTPRQMYVTSAIFVLMDISVRALTIVNKRRNIPKAPSVQEHFV
jgi:mannitol operon repressor